MASDALIPGLSAGFAGSSVLLVFLLFRRFLPVPPDARACSLEQLKAEFGSRWDALGTVFWLGSIAGIMAGTYYALDFVARRAGPAPVAGGVGYVFRIHGFLYLFPGFLLALGGAWVPTVLLLRLLLGRRYPRFAAYSALKTRFNLRPVLVGGLVVMSLLAGVAAYLFLSSHLVVDAAGVRSVRPGQLAERVHSYARVSDVVHARGFVTANGYAIDRPVYAVVFDDGDYFTTADVVAPPPDRQDEVARYVAGRAGRRIREVESLDPALRPHS